jgi:predicted phosphodiesterase
LRVAALYDVHGNVHALEAVLAEADVDTVLFGGDLASGPFPRETIDLARSLGNAAVILGNADVLSSPSMSPEWDAARRWVERQLDSERIDWLGSLPFSWHADDTLYVHANPVDVESVVHEWSSDEELVHYVDGLRESRIVTGHVHMQWDREVGRVHWICAGSVGMPYEDAPGAYWTLLDGEAFEFRRTGYDLERAAAETRASGHPMAEELADENVLQAPSRLEAKAFLTG